MLKSFISISWMVITLTFSLLILIAGGCFEKNKKQSKKVIVIGAGISGLTAAQNLYQRGYEVLVLEAKDYIGGRIKSETINGEKFELGAAWIHGDEDNPLAEILRKEGAELVPTFWRNSMFYKNGKKIKLNEESLSEFYSMIDEVKKNSTKDVSLQDVWNTFTKNSKLSESELKDLYHLLVFNIETDLGTNLKNISTWQFDEEEGMIGGDKLVLGGYDLAIKHLSKNLNIKLNCFVNKIDDNGNKVTVTTNSGETYFSDEVVVTVPLGVLQKGALRFNPELPEYKQNAIRSLRMGNLFKMFLIFDKKFWDDVDAIFILKNNETDLVNFINLEPVLKKPILLVLSAGDNVKNFEMKTEKEIGIDAYEILKTLYPDAVEPSLVVTSKWQLDRFTLGSYSYVPVGASLSMYDDIGKPFGRIHFAGEHTTSEYPSTTHGAYLSGIRVAKEIK